MVMNDIIDKTSKELDNPIDITEVRGYLKKGKVRIIIIYEDYHHKEYFKGLQDDYFLTIKDRKYIILPECITRGKNPTIMFYFNNPYPIKFKYERSKLTALDLVPIKKIDEIPELRKNELANMYLDATSLHAAFSSNLMKGLYADSGSWTGKGLIVIAVILLVVVLIILQMTGAVDILGFMSGGN